MLGKIVNLLPGKDGRVRGAELKVGKSGCMIKRPVNKLYPLLKAKIRENDLKGGVLNNSE